MASLIANCCCGTYRSHSHTHCHRAAPIIDIIAGIALLVIGALIAVGVIKLNVGALCGVFAGGAFLLGVGIATASWYCRPPVVYIRL